MEEHLGRHKGHHVWEVKGAMEEHPGHLEGLMVSQTVKVHTSHSSRVVTHTALSMLLDECAVSGIGYTGCSCHTNGFLLKMLPILPLIP
eukprot:scaffold246527_cov19-Tisochrysis_lutea.AAC.2